MLFLFAGACSSGDNKATTKGTDTATKAASSDTAATDTGSNDTASSDTAPSDSSSSDTAFSDSGSSDSGFSGTSSSGSSTTGTTSSTSSTGTPGSGYSATFKSSFVQGCAGDNPAKQGPCQCVIDKVSASIPYDEFIKNATSGDPKTLLNDPRVVQILTDCKLGAAQ